MGPRHVCRPQSGLLPVHPDMVRHTKGCVTHRASMYTCQTSAPRATPDMVHSVAYRPGMWGPRSCCPVHRVTPRATLDMAHPSLKDVTKWPGVSHPRSCSSGHRVTPGVAWAHCGPPRNSGAKSHIISELPAPALCYTRCIHCVPSLWTLSLPCTPPSSQPMGTCGRLRPTCRGLQPRYGRQSPRYGRQSPRYGRLWVGRAAKSRPTVNLSSLITLRRRYTRCILCPWGVPFTPAAHSSCESQSKVPPAQMIHSVHPVHGGGTVRSGR